MGPHCGTVLLAGLGHEAGSGKAGDSRCGAVMFNARAKESLLVAEWVFEPESEAVGMRGAAFEGPLVSALNSHKFLGNTHAPKERLPVRVEGGGLKSLGNTCNETKTAG